MAGLYHGVSFLDTSYPLPYSESVRPLIRRSVRKIIPYEPPPPLDHLRAEIGREVLRLSANESPLGPSPLAVAAIRDEATRAHLYPDGGAQPLRAALAKSLGLSPGHFLVGNGADELIGLVARACVGPRDEVLVPHPAFEPYETAAQVMGAKIVRSPLRDYRIDLPDLLAKVTPRTKVIFLANPHNPTGAMIRRAELDAFVETLPPDPLLLLDEAYWEFADDPEFPVGTELLPGRPRLLILRTFSKIAGLAGLRIGYAIGPPKLIRDLNRVREPFNVNRLAQVAALAALQDVDHRERTRMVVREEREFLIDEYRRRGFRPVPTQANFILVAVGPEAAAIRDRMLKEGVLVREGNAVGFPGHLRVTVGTREQNMRMLQALDRARG